MVKIFNPKQTVLFPDLYPDLDLPSITTLPEYDNALKNFIKISDVGAFIELYFTGLDKSYSISLSELQIPRRYRKSRHDANSPAFHLFPLSIRNQLNRFRYDARSYFNKTNSIKTSFGYFLFRQYFHLWDTHKKQFLTNVSEYLNREIGEKRYREYFKKIWSSGSIWLKEHIKRRFHHLLPPYDLALIDAKRVQLQNANSTISQLDREDPDYFLHCFILKTMHVPINLDGYIDGISILSTFKTIYLEQLKNVEIESIDDIFNLLENFPQ